MFWLLAGVLAAAQQDPAASHNGQVPPTNSPPVIRTVQVRCPSENDQPLIQAQTYLYYIHLQPSQPSLNDWRPYDAAARQTVLEDFRRLWSTGFLDNLSVDVTDEPYGNGVVGKHVTYTIAERERVKIIDFVGSKRLRISAIDGRLKAENIEIRLNTFIDSGRVRKVEDVLREMLHEQGFESAEVTHGIREEPPGSRLAHLIFHLAEGPRFRIKRIVFIGNKAISGAELQRHMTHNREWSFLSWLTGRGIYQQSAYDEDAESLRELYGDHGYIDAQIGQPEVVDLGSSPNGEVRWVELRITVVEGRRYAIGDLTLAGNTVVETQTFQNLIKLRPGSYYSEGQVRTALKSAREMYGAKGYLDFVGYPDLKRRDPALTPQASSASLSSANRSAPVVDVTLRISEGNPYFINRIIFVGNQTTHDNVIRRELQIVEGGVLSVSALTTSLKRLNQLGYFKPLDEQRSVSIEKASTGKQ